MNKQLFLAFGIFCGIEANAQTGIEDIIVEKYYISEANDTNANSIGGILPIASTTYRVYVDMLPGYSFQAAFGLPGNELRIETSTLFFNNMDYGNTTPTFSKTNAAKNTVMLDSWLSVGAACNGNYGVLKTDDDGVNTNVNTCSGCTNSPILQSINPVAGIPLTQQDGLLAGAPVAVTTIGLTGAIDVFGNTTTGNLFSTTNGSWAALGGATGPDANTNRLLIAQLTTDGVLTFKLNIQLGTPGGGTQQFVAENPTANQIQLASLNYNSSTVTDARNMPIKPLSYKIYPNPAEDTFSLEFKRNDTHSHKVAYQIINIEGKIVVPAEIFEVNGHQTQKIDVSYLSQGFYIIEVTIDGHAFNEKFLKH